MVQLIGLRVILRRGKKKIQSELNGGGFECWTEDFILYVLCNGETLKTFEWEGKNIKLCSADLPAVLG